MVEAPQYMEQGQKVLSIPMKKADKPPLMYLPLDSIKGLLEQPDLMTVHGKRDAVLLALLYDSGARVQELVDLKVGDVNLSEAVTISLTGKGGKSRSDIYPEEICERSPVIRTFSLVPPNEFRQQKILSRLSCS